MPRLANIRHEAFCREYIRLGNKTRAYRAVYDPTGTILRPGVAKALGYYLATDHPKATKRIEELRTQMQRKADITIEKILTDYQHALDIALAEGKPDSIVNAATAQAKLVGLLRDRVETGSAGEFDALDNISEILEKVASEAGVEVAQALANAFNIPRPMPTIESDANDLREIKPASDSVN